MGLKELEAASSPGPWFGYYNQINSGPLAELAAADDNGEQKYNVATVPVVSGDWPTAQGNKDQQFIIAAKTEVPKLLEAINAFKQGLGFIKDYHPYEISFDKFAYWRMVKSFREAAEQTLKAAEEILNA